MIGIGSAEPRKDMLLAPTGASKVRVAIVTASGKKTFTVDLQAGTYTFVCDPHSLPDPPIEKTHGWRV